MASPFSWPMLVPSALRAPVPVNQGVRLFVPPRHQQTTKSPMQSIASALKTGDAKTRLGIVADIVSILGVSLATVIGGSFAIAGSLDVPNILGTTIIALLCLAGACLVILLYLAGSNWIQEKFATKPSAKVLLSIALWSTFLALVLASSFVSYEFLSSTRFVKH